MKNQIYAAIIQKKSFVATDQRLAIKPLKGKKYIDAVKSDVVLRPFRIKFSGEAM
jgi:hypothetical protein